MSNREMVMNKQYKGIENISMEDKTLVMECFARWKNNRHNPNRADVKLLFAKYHEYVYKSPSDMACPSCVQMIFDYWNVIITQWTSKQPTN